MEDGNDMVEMAQAAFLDMLSKDATNCLHNPYLRFLDGISIQNCIYRCTNCLSSNALLTEKLLRDVIKGYLKMKIVSNNKKENEIMKQFYRIKKVFVAYEDERRKTIERIILKCPSYHHHAEKARKLF